MDKSSGQRPPSKSFKSTAAKYTGLAALVALETPIHESLHCLTAEATLGDCNGMAFAGRHWYLKPLEYLSLGFLKVGGTSQGQDGVTQISHSNSFLGNIGSLITSAMPEYIYTSLGMGLVVTGVKKASEKPVEGMIQTLVGGLCMSSTLNYMRISAFGAQPGHDYYNVTAKILDMVHLPNSFAAVLTPMVGIPLLFAASYATAALLTGSFKKDSDTY